MHLGFFFFESICVIDSPTGVMVKCCSCRYWWWRWFTVVELLMVDGWCLPNQMQWVGFLVRNRLKEKLRWACVGLLSVEGEKRIASELLLHSLLLWIAVFVCFRLYSNDMVKTCSISTTVRFHWLSCSFLTFGLIKFVVCGNIHKSSLFNNWDLGSWDLITLQDYLVK